MKERSKGEKATEIHTHPSTHPQNLKKKKYFIQHNFYYVIMGTVLVWDPISVLELGLYVLDWHL